MSTPRPSAGLLYGRDIHHLDHLGPLCSLLHIPLIVTEEEIASSARRYYPDLDVIVADYLTIGEFVVSHFDVIFYCIPRDLFDEVFFFAQKFLQKKVHTIWCPHGNSDKGHSIAFMEALRKEEIALVYGKQMIDFFRMKGVLDHLKSHVITGNFRHAFYQGHKDFYDQLAQQEITRRLPQAKRTILYAPTWQDYERSTSFYDAMPHLATTLPPDTNLIVKPHPNLLKDDLALELIEQHSSHPNIHFIRDFPPIFPLLNIADIYLGDMSSIGYDFLIFDRPLFFLNQREKDATQDLGLYLFRCGVEIKKEDYPQIYQLMERFLQFELRSYSEIRKEVYHYAFGHSTLDQLQREIHQAMTLFPEKDLSFF